MYHVFLTLSSLVDTWVASALPTVNNAAMNVSVQISLQDPDYNFGRYTLRSGIAGSGGNSIFNFLRTCCTVFHSSCTHVNQ